MVRSNLRRAVATWFALATVLFTSVAAACPVCASREEASSLRWVALGAFIISPWFIAGAVALYIRRGMHAERNQTGPLPTENIE